MILTSQIQEYCFFSAKLNSSWCQVVEDNALCFHFLWKKDEYSDWFQIKIYHVKTDAVNFKIWLSAYWLFYAKLKRLANNKVLNNLKSSAKSDSNSCTVLKICKIHKFSKGYYPISYPGHTYTHFLLSMLDFEAPLFGKVPIKKGLSEEY